MQVRICPSCPNLILESDADFLLLSYCQPGCCNCASVSCLSSDDLPLPVAVSLHPPVPALSSRCPQRSMSFYSGCGLSLLRPLRPPSRCCLCGSGHQHYLPVCCALILNPCHRLLCAAYKQLS